MSDYSVVIPAYNAARFVGATLDAVLSQSPAPQRVIVVDDGSKDDTVDTVRAYGRGVEIVSQVNAGPGAATTRGFQLVGTPFIASCDADDIWVPNKIERQFSALEQDTGAAAVFGRLANFRDDPATANMAKAYDGWSRTTMLIRTDIALANGPVIDPPGAGDMIDWLARLREGGNRLVMLAEVMALRRVHESSLTFRSHEDLNKGYMQVVRDAMLRRKAAAEKKS